MVIPGEILVNMVTQKFKGGNSSVRGDSINYLASKYQILRVIRFRFRGKNKVFCFGSINSEAISIEPDLNFSEVQINSVIEIREVGARELQGRIIGKQ